MIAAAENQHVLVMVPFGGGSPSLGSMDLRATHEGRGESVEGSDTQFGPQALEDHPIFQEFIARQPLNRLWVPASPENMAGLYGITPDGNPSHHPGGLSYEEFHALWSDPNDPVAAAKIQRFLDDI